MALKSSPKNISLCSWGLEAPSTEALPNQLMVLPGREINGRDGRKWTMKQPQLVLSMLNSIGRPIQIDENHSSVLKAPKGERSEALGWLSQFRLAEDGSLWADKVEWTGAGKELLSRQAYRYLSPALHHTHQREGDVLGDVMGIHSIALTNDPNLVSLPALNTSEDAAMKPEQLKALGLAEGATDEQVMARIQELDQKSKEPNNLMQEVKDMFTALAAKLSPVDANSAQSGKGSKDENFELALNMTLDRFQAEKKIAPNAEARAYFVATTKDAAQLKALVAHLEKAPALVNSNPAQISLNSQQGGSNNQNQTAESKLTASQLKICKSLNVTAEQFLAQPSLASK